MHSLKLPTGTTPACAPGHGHALSEPVRLVGVGAGAGDFVARLHGGLPAPQANVLGPCLATRCSGSADAGFMDPCQQTVVLFIALSSDAERHEIDAAIALAYGASATEVHVIAILVQANGATLQDAEWNVASVDEVIESQISLHPAAPDDHLHALAWLLAGLRCVLDEGSLVPGACVKLPDLVLARDLPGSCLHLATHAVGRGSTMADAWDVALRKLTDGGVDLGCAQGIVIVLWHAPDQAIRLRDACAIEGLDLTAIAGRACLKMNARSDVAWKECAFGVTLLVSMPHSLSKELIA